MGNYNVQSYPFAFDKLLAGDFDLLGSRILLAGGQGVLKRGSALGASRYSVSSASATAGNTGTAAISGAVLKSGATAGTYLIKCTNSAAPATFAVYNPLGNRISDASAGTAYSDQIGFTLSAGAAAGDSFSVVVADTSISLALTDIATGENGGEAILTAASALSGALPGQYIVECISVSAGGVGTFSVTDPQGNAVGTATQAVAFATKISFTIGGGAPDVGDIFYVTFEEGAVTYTLVSQSAVDGSQKLAAILADDNVDTTSGAVYAAAYETGAFNRDAVIFATADSYINHLSDSPTIFLQPIHP